MLLLLTRYSEKDRGSSSNENNVTLILQANLTD